MNQVRIELLHDFWKLGGHGEIARTDYDCEHGVVDFLLNVFDCSLDNLFRIILKVSEKASLTLKT